MLGDEVLVDVGAVADLGRFPDRTGAYLAVQPCGEPVGDGLFAIDG
jgi:hypothetical protein